MQIGNLDRRVQFKRGARADNGLARAETFSALGSPVWANRRDMTDKEKETAGQTIASKASRFVVRWSAFAAGVAVTDRLACEGLEFGIDGIRELGRREWIEITASARVDL